MKRRLIGLTAVVFGAVFSSGIAAAPGGKPETDKQAVVDHWTPARRAAAEPRDFVIDKHGRGYLRRADGSLVAHGRAGGDQLTATNPAPVAGPPGGGGGGSDTTPPSITNMQPPDNSTIGASATFSAVVTDASGIRSVTFVVTYPDGVTTQNFTPSFVGNNTWQTNLQGFTSGQWRWRVVAKDKAKGGNTATSVDFDFTVDTGGGGGGGGDVVTNAPWTAGGDVQTAVGRIYFEMPSNARRTRWAGYVCSGTVVTDSATGRSVIQTAAHCVYDDAYKAFARNVMFIPNQDGTTGSGTDLNCSNDPLGCWVPSFGVVDTDWTTRTFPDNIPWDYAYYVVPDSGAHSGNSAGTDVLDAATPALDISFATPVTGDAEAAAGSPEYTHALGYSYSDDPNFMYCAQGMTTEGSDNWWLASCGLSGGSSGGPWVQPLSGGTGPLISVNSWGYTNQPGMAGPKLSGTSAQCVFVTATSTDFSGVSSTDGNEGVAINCP